jgi:hypothetical protein
MAEWRESLETDLRFKKKVQVFINMKGKPLLEFSDEDRISDFAFLMDMKQHLNDLNLQLQGRNQLVNGIFAHVKAFEVKLRSIVKCFK